MVLHPYFLCEFYSAFIVLLNCSFEALSHCIPKVQIGKFFLRRNVNIFFLSISPNICFGTQMNYLLEMFLLRSHS